MATGTKLRVRIIDRAGGLSYAKITGALKISKQVATDKLINLFIKTTQALKDGYIFLRLRAASII